MGNQVSQGQQNQAKPASPDIKPVSNNKSNVEPVLVNDDDIFQEILEISNELLNDYRSKFLQEDFCNQLALVYQDKLSHINLQLLKSINNKVNSNEPDERLMMVLQYLPKPDDSFEIDVFQEKLKDYFWKQNVTYTKEKLEAIQNIKVKGNMVKNPSYVIDFKHVNKLLGNNKNNANNKNVNVVSSEELNTLVETNTQGEQQGGGKKRRGKKIVFRIKKVSRSKSKSQKGGENNRSNEMNKSINDLLNNNENNNNANYSNNNNSNEYNTNQQQRSLNNVQNKISSNRKRFLESNNNFSNENAVKLIQRDFKKQKYGRNNSNRVTTEQISNNLNRNLQKRLGKNNFVVNENKSINNVRVSNNLKPANNLLKYKNNQLNTRNNQLKTRNNQLKTNTRNIQPKLNNKNRQNNILALNEKNKKNNNLNKSKENISYRVNKKLKYFVPRSYTEPTDFCKGEKICKMTKKQICQSITENIIVRMNIVAAILTTIPYKNEKGEYEGGICYKKYLNLIDCKVCVPYNYEQLLRSDVYEMVNQILDHAEYLDKESCKASQGYFLELNNAQKEALISRRSKDDNLNPSTKFNEFYIECMDKLKDKYFEILKALIVILKNLQANVIISNADLNIISTEVKRLIDDLYNSTHCYYVLAIIALIKSDIRILEKDKFNYDTLYNTALHNKNIGNEQIV